MTKSEFKKLQETIEEEALKWEAKLNKESTNEFYQGVVSAYRWSNRMLTKKINKARKGFMTFDLARKMGKKITNLKGKELIRWAEAYANAKNEKWAKRWLGDEK